MVFLGKSAACLASGYSVHDVERVRRLVRKCLSSGEVLLLSLIDYDHCSFKHAADRLRMSEQWARQLYGSCWRALHASGVYPVARQRIAIGVLVAQHTGGEPKEWGCREADG